MFCRIHQKRAARQPALLCGKINRFKRPALQRDIGAHHFGVIAAERHLDQITPVRQRGADIFPRQNLRMCQGVGKGAILGGKAQPVQSLLDNATLFVGS